MARERIVVRRWGTANGQGLRVTLLANKEWLDLMSARERNATLKAGGRKAGLDWRNGPLLSRFSKRVLSAPFNYRGDHRSPLLDSGHMKRNARKATVKTTAPGGRLRIRVAFKFGHHVSKEIRRVMKVLPPSEVEFIANQVGKFLLSERGKLTRATRGRKINGQRRLKLSSSQRRRFGVRNNRRRR